MCAAPTASQPAATDEPVTTTLYRAAIGPVRNPYYLPRLLRMDDQPPWRIDWNWAACLCTLNWLLFRKLWGAALAYSGAVVGCSLLLFGIGGLVVQFSDLAAMAAAALLALLAFVLPGLWGTALFQAHCRKRMAQALTGTATLPEACAQLLAQAPTRRRLGLQLALNLALLAALVGVYSLFQSVSAPYREARPRAVGPVVSGMTTTQIGPQIAPPASAPRPQEVASTPALAASLAPVVLPSSAPAAPVAAHASVPVPAPIASAAEPALAASAPAARSSSPKRPAALRRRMTPAQRAQAHARAAEPGLAAGWHVNVGLFAKDANANRVYAQLELAGLAPRMQVLYTQSKGRLVRVRLGPYHSRALAAASAGIAQGLGLEAVIFQK